ncbi:unnamed protein product [Diatraea saccharalis]|uniref:Gag-like protein n=1 Tax=Diatraea saccharalis TaxID=40085 RepID=A0A9N9QZ35_9NEOP|nr:unnamed protein product [Diatraea saccharalis]
MNKAQKPTTTGNPRHSDTSSPSFKEDKMDEFKRKLIESIETQSASDYMVRLVDLLSDIPKLIYGGMKKEVKENLEMTAKTGITLVIEMSKEIKKDSNIMVLLKGRLNVAEQLDQINATMKEELKKIMEKMEKQEEELIKYREEKRRSREDEESVTTKFLRMIDYKLENIKSREEALFDRFSDRTLKDNEMSTAIITRKLDTMEENLTAETIELERKIVNRLGRKTDMEESMRNEINTNIEQQIKETGREMTLEITKTIDTVLTDCMQDIQNTITYGGTAPEGNKEILNELGNLEANLKETLIDTKEAITGSITKTIERVTSKESITPVETQETSTYADIAKGRNNRRPKTMHSILISSKNQNDMAEDIINKTKTILKPIENGTQIERIRKVKDQRIVVSCREEQEIEKLKERINESEELEAEKVRNKNPLIMIKEVKYKMTDEEIVSAIRRQNPDVYMDDQEEDDFKIKYRRRTRNTEKCHIIAQIKPAFWKRIIKKGHLYIEMERVRVEDQTPLIQCTRCLNFGHGRKFCQESADRCSHCGGLHLRAECPDRKAGVPPQCCNCTHAELPDVNHNAFSNNCKVREKWDSLARSTTAYD